MNITLVVNGRMPVAKYGGTQRVVWALGRALAAMGHRVTMVCGRGSVSPFARIVERDPSVPLESQIPADSDVVHFQDNAPPDFLPPHLITCNGNRVSLTPRQRLVSVYVSRDHARRFGCEAYVHNGLDWDMYAGFPLQPAGHRRRLHFLAKAAWRVKNVAGAIDVALAAAGGMPFGPVALDVLGGSRLNFKMGFRFTLSPRIRFHGMADDALKAAVMGASRGLLFPVRWHEPFGLAVTESLYMGAPVFATPYGSLPELVTPEVGFLTADAAEMAARIRDCAGDFSPSRCREYAADLFGAELMARRYLALYEKVAAGRPLNPSPVGPEPDPMRRLPWC